MSTTKLITITASQQLELPPDIQATLQPGDEYLVWQHEDTSTLKKIQKPMTLVDIRAKIRALGPDPEELSIEEISQIVREVRQQD